MPIDPQFIDHDLTPPEGMATGLIEQDAESFAAGVLCQDIEATGNLIPRSQWDDWANRREPALRASVRTILNQGREGSCVGNACVGAAMVCGALQYGSDWRELSAMSLYERIGRTASSGAMIPDGIAELTDRGALPLDSPANRDEFATVYPANGFNPRRLRKLDWEPTAKLFRATDILRINTADGFFSALCHGWPTVYGRQQHCIYSVLPKKSRGKWYFGYANSWGSQWGDELNDTVGKGLGWDSERTISNSVGYAVRDVTRRPRIEMG
jgi:hypothetical protein